jgi:queuine/archaeosine tRNA-ribosyltransferase
VDVSVLISNFNYRKMSEKQIEDSQNVRELGVKLALLIDEVIPDSREKSLAITKLEESIMWANKGISLNTKEKESEI